MVSNPAIGVAIKTSKGYGRNVTSVGMAGRRWAVALGVALAATAIWALPRFSANAQDLCPGADSDTLAFPAELESATLCVINQERGARGLQPLAFNPQLQAMARAHSADMVTRQFFSSTNPDQASEVARAAASGYGGRGTRFGITEAIGFGVGSDTTPRAIVAKWLSDFDPRQTLLSASHQEAGIGVFRGVPTGPGEEGATFTADLAHRLPEAGRRIEIEQLSGPVLYDAPGDEAGLQPVMRKRVVPVGTVVDARGGPVRVISASNLRGKLQSGVFSRGVFRVRQRRTRTPVTELLLRGGRGVRCGRGQARSSQTRRSRRVRRLWGRSRRGARFVTRGRYAVATTRGTRWIFEDRCDGSFVRVLIGVLEVRDLVRGVTFRLGPGQSRFIRGRL
jgi:uncharacterized protein YkwD